MSQHHVGSSRAGQGFRGGVRTVLAVAAITLAACTTSGSTFDTSSLDLLIPGQTTLDEASALLKSEPTDVYRQRSGAATARWAHHSSLVTDAVYFNRELWLYFDETGVFRRVVRSHNVPMAEQKIGQAHQPQPPAISQPLPANDGTAAGTPVSQPVAQPIEPEVIIIPGPAE